MTQKATTSKWIVVRDSRIHGKGVFASRDISKGTKIIEYVGEKITKKEAEKRADAQIELSMGNENVGAVYIFELDDNYDIDGGVEWNTARLINHSCSPNCETEDDEGRIWILALRNIKKGEELSYNYGYDIDDYEEHPCKCGAQKCVGYILNEKYWGKLRKKLNSSNN